MPSLRIIIVNYNSGEWLQRSVLSALAYSDAQITVVDNASQDRSMDEAKGAITSERVTWVHNSDNVGFAAANNQVLKQLDADFAILMNPDCELRPQTISMLLNAFELNRSFGLVSCRILNEDLSLQTTCRRRFPTPWSALVRMLKLHVLFPKHKAFADFDYGNDVNPNDKAHTVEAISGAFMMVKQQALNEVGLLDEGYFMHCEDLDWCKRFASSSWQVGFVPAAAVVHAKGVSSKSRPIGVLWTLHKGMNRFYDKFYHDSYSWPLRITVKAGIYLSFVVRAAKSLLGKFSRAKS